MITKTTECFVGMSQGEESFGTLTKNGERRLLDGRIEANTRPEVQWVSDGCDTPPDEEMRAALPIEPDEVDAVFPSDCGGDARGNGAGEIRERARFAARKNLWQKFETFLKHVDQSGDCWIWNGPQNRGYGTFNFNGHPIKAHRFSWFIAYGYLPTDFLCHRCDVRNCVRPSHLFVGDAQANNDDMMAKGRSNPVRPASRGWMFREFTCKERGDILGLSPNRTTQALEPALDKIAMFYLRDPVRTLAMLARHADRQSEGMRMMKERRNVN